MNGEHFKQVKEVEEMLLNVGTLLMSNGASTGRVRTTVSHIAEALEYEVELMIVSRALMLTVTEESGAGYTSSVRRTSPHGVNFKIVSGISRLSWRVIEDKLAVDQINEDIKRLTSLPHYPRLVVLSLVAVAGASFCRLFGGHMPEMIVAFCRIFRSFYSTGIDQIPVQSLSDSGICLFCGFHDLWIFCQIGYWLQDS